MTKKKEKKHINALIGIGASAGGLDPLMQLVAQLPEQIDHSCIIVAQHMSPNYESKLVDLIQRKTKLKVHEAENGILLSPNQIFVAPPNFNIEIVNQSIYLSQSNEIGPKPSVNLLFETMAKNSQVGQKIGIVLSGTGNDGTKGLEAIKNAGGITIAQDPTSSKYDGMPGSAIDQGHVHLVMLPEQIGQKLPEILSPSFKIENINGQVVVQSETYSEIDHIIRALSTRMGINFNGYKTSTLYRRIEKRMSDGHFRSIKAYLEHIHNQPEELDVLFQNVLIGVTQFFRDTETFEETRNLLRGLIKQSNNPIRIWVPGCATGEEAYSIAIMIHQLINSDFSKISIQIFATDIDENALQVARRGVYTAAAVQNISEDLLNRYFDKVGGGFELNKVIRKMVLFSRHDLSSNPPFLRINLISCRNLLIYFDHDLQNHVIPMFHYSLTPGGYLVLGKSETIGDFNNLFTTIDQKNKIYQKKETSQQYLKLPYLKLSVSSKSRGSHLKKQSENISVHDMVKETFYQSFEHPYIVIDENMEMVEVTGNVSHVISIRPGPVSSNVLKLIDKNLQIELRAVVSHCFRTGEVAKGNIRRIKVGDSEVMLIRIVARPLLFSKSGNPLYMVVFENIETDNNIIKVNESYGDNENSRIIELEHELSATKEHMNTLIEELETFNEELQATNEELQSSNEELQASNEELETSNEELQSTNEELEIAYNELRTASNEIERQNEVIRQNENNLRTVFNNTLQGFLLVDKKYTIITFNKTAEDIYLNAYGKKITAGDSFIDLIAPEELEDFYKNFQLALKGRLVSDKILIKHSSREDIWLNYNYSPVTDEDNPQNIDHIIISFIDYSKHNLLIDQRDKLMQELQERNEELKKANQNLDNFVHIIAHDLRSPLGNMKMVAHQFEDASMGEVKELVPILHKCVDRLDNTINGLVKIIEIEGAQKIVESSIDLEELINDVKYELRGAINENKAVIRVHNIEGKRINYVRAFLTSIFYNLLSNSIKYSKSNKTPEINIEIQPVKLGYQVNFSDNGIGIDMEKYGERLFTPFKRIAKNGKMGLGVGLHMIKNMIEKNGGKIEVESEVGKGTTFRIFLKEYHD